MAENNEYFLTLPAFEEASQKVKEVTVPTELIYSDYFSNQSGNKVYLKPENMQRTGAYKIRGKFAGRTTELASCRTKNVHAASLPHLPETMHRVLHWRHSSSAARPPSSCPLQLLSLR